MKMLPLGNNDKPKMRAFRSRYKPTQDERVIYNFNDGTYMCFDWGKDNEYCVFVRSAQGLNFCPLDKDYFKYAQDLARICTNWKLYMGFLNVYTRVQPHQKDVMPEHIDFIAQVSLEYAWIEKEVFLLFMILYAAMIAEENWNDGKTYIGKEIKKVGMFKALIANVDPKEASDILRKTPWKQIHKESIEQDCIIENLTDKGREIKKWQRNPTNQSLSLNGQAESVS